MRMERLFVLVTKMSGRDTQRKGRQPKARLDCGLTRIRSINADEPSMME
jgi:hypothetical protein